MENSLTFLYIVSVSALIISEFRLRYALIFALSPLAVLVRPELVIWMGLLVFWITIKGKAKLIDYLFVIIGVILLLIISSQVGFRIIPQTARAKAIFLQQESEWYSIWTLIKIFAASSFFIVAGAIFVLFAARAKSDAYGLFIVACAYAFAVSMYLITKNSLISTRYDTSIFSPLLFSSLLVIWQSGLSNKLIVKSFLIIHIVISIVFFMFFSPVKAHDDGAAIGKFALKAKEIILETDGIGSSVAMSEVGAFGYFSGLKIADTLGLVSDHALNFYDRTGVEPKSDISRFLADENIDYYVETFGGEAPISDNDPSFQLLLEARITRNNMSRGALTEDIWRLYRFNGVKVPK